MLDERALAASLLCVERREILREAFAQPLFVIVLPSNGLPPPLVRELVRQEELRKAFECRRVVAPVGVRHRQRVFDDREVPGTMPAWQVAFEQGNRRGSHAEYRQ